MGKRFSTVAAFLLLAALAIQAQTPGAAPSGAPSDTPSGAPGGRGGRGGRGGFAPKNLQVLNAATFPDSMRPFVEALGLADKGRCGYRRVEDRDSGEKMH